jgi:hypothetical protein
MSNLKKRLENPPPPGVRPGQKKPYVKPTVKELRERYDIVAQLLAHKTKGQIHDFCRERWNVEWRTADRYMACAREGMLAALGLTKQEMRALSATIREKLFAVQRIDELFGLALPRTVEVSGPGAKESAVAPAVILYLPDNGRYDPAPGTPRAANPDAAKAAAQPANEK